LLRLANSLRLSDGGSPARGTDEDAAVMIMTMKATTMPSSCGSPQAFHRPKTRRLTKLFVTGI